MRTFVVPVQQPLSVQHTLTGTDGLVSPDVLAQPGNWVRSGPTESFQLDPLLAERTQYERRRQQRFAENFPSLHPVAATSRGLPVPL